MDTKGDKESGRNWEIGTDIGIYILYIYLCFSIVYSIYIYIYIYTSDTLYKTEN